MTLFSFAYRNIMRDFKTYLYYSLNCVFSVVIFFLFAVLSFHPTLSVIDENSTLGLVLIAAEIISIGFSIAFISYSVSNFLKSRSRQFGLITILGGTKKQLNKIIFLENMIIGSLSIVVGIITGVIFSKLFLTIAGKMIGGLQLGFYVPVEAIVISIVVLGGAFFLISTVTPHLVRKQKIIKLIKTEEMEEKSPNMVPIYITFVGSGIVLLFGAMNKNWMDVFNYLVLPIGAVFIICTSYILFYLAIHLYIHFSKKMKKYYYGTNLISMTNIKGSMRTNLQSLTISTVLYTIAFLSIILMVSSAGNVENETRKIMPYAYMYASWTETANTEEHVQAIENELNGLPGYKKEKFTFYKYPELESRHCIISESQYNTMAKFLGYESLKLGQEDTYLIAGNVQEIPRDLPNFYRKKLEEKGISIQLAGSSEKLLALSGYLNNTTVVSDDVFHMLRGELESFDIYAFDVSNWVQVKQETDRLIDHFSPIRASREGTFITARNYYETEQLTQNLILYVGSVLCFSFLLAVASFIYSRLYSTMEKECEKYKGIVKIGLSKLELNKSLNSIVKMIVLVPFALALIYMWIGVFVIDQYSIISNVPTAIVCTIIYTVMQVIIYFVIRKMYRKDIVRGVYGEESN